MKAVDSETDMSAAKDSNLNATREQLAVCGFVPPIGEMLDGRSLSGRMTMA